MKRMRASTRSRKAAALGVVVLLSCAGCRRDGREQRSGSTEATAAAWSERKTDALPSGESQAAQVDLRDPAPARLWLQELEAAHRAADGASDAVGRREALELLTSLYARGGSLPGSVDEIVQLRQDIAVRAARLELAASRPKEALSWAQRGLSLSQEASVLRATLWLVVADAHEARGNPGDARQALKQALAINQELLDRELEEP